MKHDIKKLPKWAQDLIRDMTLEIDGLKALRKIHSILSAPHRDWFTIKALTRDLKLWMLDKDAPHCVCVLSKDDMLFVGRAVHMHMHNNEE